MILFVSSILGIVINLNSCSRFQEQQVHLLSVPLMCPFLLKVKRGNLPACTEAESHKVFLNGVAGIDRLPFVTAVLLFQAGETGTPINFFIRRASSGSGESKPPVLPSA